MCFSIGIAGRKYYITGAGVPLSYGDSWATVEDNSVSMVSVVTVLRATFMGTQFLFGSGVLFLSITSTARGSVYFTCYSYHLLTGSVVFLLWSGTAARTPLYTECRRWFPLPRTVSGVWSTKLKSEDSIALKHAASL